MVLSNEFPEAEVVLLHVIDPGHADYAGCTSLPVSSEEWFERREAAAEELLDDLEGLTTPDGGPVERVIDVSPPTKPSSSTSKTTTSTTSSWAATADPA